MRYTRGRSLDNTCDFAICLKSLNKVHQISKSGYQEFLNEYDQSTWSSDEVTFVAYAINCHSTKSVAIETTIMDLYRQAIPKPRLYQAYILESKPTLYGNHTVTVAMVGYL